MSLYGLEMISGTCNHIGLSGGNGGIIGMSSNRNNGKTVCDGNDETKTVVGSTEVTECGVAMAGG